MPIPINIAVVSENSTRTQKESPVAKAEGTKGQNLGVADWELEPEPPIAWVSVITFLIRFIDL